MMNKINPNESDFVKNIRKNHCKGCMNENGYCTACTVLDCWLRKTYLPDGEWVKACETDLCQKMSNEISNTINQQILNEIVK